MTRTGKIARLPRDVREELNRRMEDGEEGASLLGWLNSQPVVQEVLSAKFGGRLVSEQNLSAWRQGGYEDWVAHQEIVTQVEELAVNAEELKGMAKKTQLTEHLATLVAVRYAEVLANPHNEPDEQWERKVRTLRSLCRDVIAMRKCEQRGERLGMEQQRWSFECHDLEEKRLARERAKARAAEMAPFDARVQRSILTKVHGERDAARVAEIMHDLPRGSLRVQPRMDTDEHGLKAGEVLADGHLAKREDGGSRMEDGEDLAVGHQAAELNQGESSLIMVDQGCREGNSRERAQRAQDENEVPADGQFKPNQGESSLIKAAASPGSEFGVPGSELRVQPRMDTDEHGLKAGEVLADGHGAEANQGESSLIKADQGSPMSTDSLPAKVLADGRANSRERAQGAQNEDEVLADGHQADGHLGEREDGGLRIEDGQVVDSEGDDAGQSEGESSPIKVNQGSEMVEGTAKMVEATDGTDFTDSEFGVEGQNGGNENSEMEVLADGHQAVGHQAVDGANGEQSKLDASNENGGIDIQETALRLAVSQIYEILKGFKLEKELFDPKSYAAIANCLAKLSKGALDIEKFQESVAEQRQQREAELDQDKPKVLSPETIAKCQEMLDRM